MNNPNNGTFSKSVPSSNVPSASSSPQTKISPSVGGSSAVYPESAAALKALGLQAGAARPKGL